ncbi:serine hydroxymethyltransferase [Fictibacillus sp. KIGAM418]|uniref:Probable serine hydroxymethyltransferase n=1 Tax=Fictibacillus marinisediminis TaxID=2878389 RepID=A0A9X2BGZ9_9BACL|nr:serine hydroxymethyltransferase [Fictibacillus marinisediminis]MCK6258792.1 serine hydroxymethyltransferase [Fictibacillus marinisediminis]
MEDYRIRESFMEEFASDGVIRLANEDPELFALLDLEHQRQVNTLSMVASSSVADPSVLACEGSILTNVTTEGYPGRRFHGGCKYIDEVEKIAVERAKLAFGARYVNVQPHSGSSANQIVMFSILRPGDRVLGLDLDSGGHLTHGSRASFSGQVFESFAYGLDETGRIDYDQVLDLAKRHRPHLIICGASAYTRVIDFERFRKVADEIGAFLLADISHIAGLVASGVHPSPIDHAHFTTTSTYKQLYGPRGGLIMSGRDWDTQISGSKTLAEVIHSGVFPKMQGTPTLSGIAAKARALAIVNTTQFRTLAQNIVSMAREFGEVMSDLGYCVLTGGTDNHMVLVDIGKRGLSGKIAENVLEESGIIVNKNKIPGDKRGPLVTSGIRFGTNSLAIRGMDAAMKDCATLIDKVLSRVEPINDTDYRIESYVVDEVKNSVIDLCRRYPLPHYEKQQVLL